MLPVWHGGNMTEYVIDLKTVFGVDDLHEILEDTLDFPEYYERSLDTLKEVFEEQTYGWHLKFTGCSDAEAILGRFMGKFRRACEEAEKTNEFFKAEFED